MPAPRAECRPASLLAPAVEADDRPQLTVAPVDRAENMALGCIADWPSPILLYEEVVWRPRSGPRSEVRGLEYVGIGRSRAWFRQGSRGLLR